MSSNRSSSKPPRGGGLAACRAAGSLALLACLVSPRAAHGDGYVMTAVPAKDGQPGFLVTVKVGGVPFPFIVTIDTGDGKPDNGGLMVNGNPGHNTAKDIGMKGGTPGQPVQTAGGGVMTPTDNANMPTDMTVKPPPTTNPGSKTTQPPLPDKGSIADLGGQGGADALIGIKWLDDNFRSWGQTQGKNGKFFFLTKKDESADDAIATHTLAVALAGDIPKNPDGRPVGTDFKPLVFVPARLTSSGALFVNGGFATDLTLSNPAAGTRADQQFIISSGMSRSLISPTAASQLGLDPDSLPLGTVDTGFGSLTVPVADLQMKVFSDPQFPSLDVPVGILSAAGDPLNENFLGNDVLSKLSYWEMSPSGDGRSGTFYAAASVPGPSALVMIMIGAPLSLIGYTRRRLAR